MHVRSRDNSITIWTPGKLNLFLEIRAKRDDGFHEIESLLTAVNIYDTLSFAATPTTTTLNFSCRWAHGIRPRPVPDERRNLALQALTLLRERCGFPCGAEIQLIKRIPMEAGMGGASSDAAAALVAGNLGWKLGLALSDLTDLAAELGSDVPFFLHSSPAICRGRGELISPLPPGYDHHDCYVIVAPECGLSTADVYRASCIPAAPRNFDESPGSFTWFNRLQEAAATLSSDVERLADCFGRTDVIRHQLTGSGSAYFGACTDRRQALRAANQLRQMGWNDVLVARAARHDVPAWAHNQTRSP